jgi:hypothetical protein
MFEWYTTVPAILSMIVHSLLHVSIADGVEIAAEEFNKSCESHHESIGIELHPETVGNTVMVVVGLLLLSSSGFLYVLVGPPHSDES